MGTKVVRNVSYYRRGCRVFHRQEGPLRINMKQADVIANQYNNAKTQEDKDRLKKEWYKEIKRVASYIDRVPRTVVR